MHVICVYCSNILRYCNSRTFIPNLVDHENHFTVNGEICTFLLLNQQLKQVRALNQHLHALSWSTSTIKSRNYSNCDNI